jgi:hypothetical protein
MQLDILHLGDLHICKENFQEAKLRIDALLKDLKTLKVNESIKPQIVIFTGDLIQSGDNWNEQIDLAINCFLKPLLETLKINESNFFYSPGNHEIEQNKVSQALEDGITKIIDSTESSRKYISSLKDKLDEFNLLQGKLGHFIEYRKTCARPFLKKETFFYESHLIEMERLKVGISVMNSAWRSSQYGSDKEKILVDIDQIHQSIDPIRDCDIKILMMHHSIEMMPDWNRNQLKRMMAKEVDFVFTGHYHDSDILFVRPVLGNLYLSTCGCLSSEKIPSGYSIVRLDLSQKKVTTWLRRWYENRLEFDAETDKCKDGKVIYDGLKADNQVTNEMIEISDVKGKIRNNNNNTAIIKPLEISDIITIEDVYVDPIINERSSYDKTTDEKKSIGIDEALKQQDNILIFGRREYGKTSLLLHIQQAILKDSIRFEKKIPVFLTFNLIPKNNYRSIVRNIIASLDKSLDEDQVEKHLIKGNFIILIDDYDDFRDSFREKRIAVLNQFHKAYPDCQLILTATEQIGQQFKSGAIRTYESLKPKICYLASLNTTLVREILKKWNKYQAFDVESMLNQIVFFFQQLRIPVTPMAVTLFIGVLFRDKSKKNITNEAYLIENYLEDVLEKIEPEHVVTDLDFRDKESFLANIAFRMVELGKYHLSTIEFEKEKLDYFTNLGDDLPREQVFNGFIEKGILEKTQSTISFKFRFWFNFFLAKAMQKDSNKKKFLLEHRDYLKYSTAFGYKAGLDRNDVELLDIIEKRLLALMSEAIASYEKANLEPIKIEQGLIQFSEKLENEIREKNVSNEKDIEKDNKYLSYDPDEQDVEERTNYDDVIPLVTLYSDAIRNSTEIDATKKMGYLKNNIRSFICLMWVSLDSLKSFIETASEAEIKKLLMLEKSGKDREQLVEFVKQFVLQVIPVSVINYMSDHLYNTRLKNSVNILLQETNNINERLFYVLLLLKLDINDALWAIETLIEDTSSLIIDSIIAITIRIYCYENEIEEKTLNEVIRILQKIRSKHAIKVENNNVPIRDTFASDFRESVKIKRTKDKK